MKKILTVLFVCAMMCVMALSTRVLANEFTFEVQSRENFAGNDSVGKGTVHTLNGREVCEPGFGVTFTESNGKVMVTFTQSDKTKIPAGATPKVNAKDNASLQALRLYFPAGALGNIAGVDLLKNEKFELKKGVVATGYEEGSFDSILIAGAGFALNQAQILNIDWAVFEAALNGLIANNANFFLLGHYSIGYGAGGANSIQIARLNLVYGGEEIAHFASASFDKFIDGWYTNPYVNGFSFNVKCDDCTDCVFGPFKCDANGKVTVYVCDQTGAQILADAGLLTKAQVVGGCHTNGVEGCHYTICEVLPNGSPWVACTESIGFCVIGGEACFDEVTECDEDGIALFENGAKNSFDFWMAVHFAKGSGGPGGDDTTTLTLGGANGGSTGQGWGFTYFNASGLSLTNPIECIVMKGGKVVDGSVAIVSLEVNKAGNLEIVIRFENFNVSGAVHVGVSATEAGVKSLTAPGNYPFSYTVANNTVTIPYSVFQSFIK